MRDVDFGGNFGVVSFPDGATDEQVLAEYNRLTSSPPPRAADLGPLDYAKQIAGSAIRGAGETFAGIPESLDIARESILGTLPESLQGPARAVSTPGLDILSDLTGGAIPGSRKVLRGTSEGIRKATKAVSPEEVPGLENSFWATQVPAGIGSALAFIAGGEVGTALKVPRWLSVAGLGSASSGSQFYNDAKQSGADERTAQIASLIGNVVGTSEALGAGRVMRHLDKITKNTFTKALLESGKDTLEEAAQEAFQQTAQNLTAKSLYDSDRELYNSVAENAGVGGVTGFLLSAIAQAAGIPVKRRYMRQGEQRRQNIIGALERGETLPQPIPEGINYATSTGAQLETPSQQAQRMEQEAQGQIRLRGTAQDRLEAETGAPLVQAFESRATVNYPETEAGLGHALKNVATLIKLGQANGFITPEQAATFTQAGDQIFTDSKASGFGQALNQAEYLRQSISDTLKKSTRVNESKAPTVKIPIQIQQADGTVVPGEFTGYYDMREFGKGTIPSVGFTLPNGKVTHGLLKADQKIIGDVPSFEEWSKPSESRAAQPGDIQALASVRRQAGALSSEWKNAPPIETVASFSDLPESIQNTLLRNGSDPSQTQAVALPGLNMVYLIAGNIKGDVRPVVLHEVIGHIGVNEVFGGFDEYQKFMNEVSRLHLDSSLGAQIRDLYGDNPLTVGEEIVAALAEDPSPDPNLWQRIVAIVKEWVRKRFNIGVSDNDVRYILSKSRQRIQGGGSVLSAPINRILESRTPATPSQFQSRQQVEAAISDPLLQPSQVQAAKDLAAVQSSMVSDEIMGWLMGQPLHKADEYAQSKLNYLQDRRFMADQQQWLKDLPNGEAKDVAGAAILAHYGIDRATEGELNAELTAKKTQMGDMLDKAKKMLTQQTKAKFLTALFNNLTGQYKTYLVNLSKSQGTTMPAQFREKLNKAQQKLQQFQQSPTALQNALKAIAIGVPNNLLQPGITNAEIINNASYNGLLNGVVSTEVRDWLLADDGTGNPALLGYNTLVDDLSNLREILNNQQSVASDINAFEKWFRPSGKTGQVSAKSFAESYFKFRTARDKAIKIAGTIAKQIGSLDTEIHGLMIAKERLSTLMSSQPYVDTVTEASRNADVVVRAIYENPTSRTGLIERDKNDGVWTLKGPISGTDYVVNLHPSSFQEKENRGKLKDFAKEARDFADQNANTNPVLADSYASLATYIDRNYVHPALDPEMGFAQSPWLKIPGTVLRFGADPFGAFPKTIRDTLEKIGGRTVRQLAIDSAELDTVMRRIEGLNNHKDFGFAKTTSEILKAMESHDWYGDSFGKWDEQIAEPVIASSQNTLSPSLVAGDIVPGSDGIKITTEDIAAIKVMKRWQDEVMRSVPNSIRDQYGDLFVTRKPGGSGGRYTMARTAAPWTATISSQWAAADTSEKKIAMLKHPVVFRRIVLGYIHEANPEFDKMNPASDSATKLYKIFRRMTAKEKLGVQQFTNWDDTFNFIADEMVDDGLATNSLDARVEAEKIVLSDVDKFIKDFVTNVQGQKSEEIWGSVPSAVVAASTANNSFTMKRSRLAAPSTFYSYSTGADGARLHYVGSVRSLLNLKIIQSGYEAMKSLQKSKQEMDDKITEYMQQGKAPNLARELVIQETEKLREQSEIRYDYLEIAGALRLLEKTMKEIERFEISTHEHFQHPGIALANSIFSTIKSSLLSGPQAVVTNYWSGTMLGPAMTHIQTGRLKEAVRDFVFEPHFFKTIYQRIAQLLEDNPVASKLLKKHEAFFGSFAKNIAQAAHDWRRIQHIAEESGMVSPYNFKAIWHNKEILPATAGRLEQDDRDSNFVIELANRFLSSKPVRLPTEAVKATTPRMFDNLINYSLINAFEQETNMLKVLGWAAFKDREIQAAASGKDFKDLSDPKNILTPGDLRLKRFKYLERYRQWFAGVGSLDQVLLDYYERTKNMSEEDRMAEPLMGMQDTAAVALQYASTTNVSTETNRPYLFKGKGSEGVLRNIAGTFMGWTINMLKNFSRELQTHSGDKNFSQIQSNMLAIGTMVMLFAVAGAWNWEFGDELTKLLFGQESARIKPGNVIKGLKEGEAYTAAKYFAQALINTVPVVSTPIGVIMGLPYTGRGNPFDLTSQNPIFGMIYDTWNTSKRIIQTGDAVLPLADYVRRWVPLSRMLINRLPIVEGLNDQGNAIKALNASAPPGTEIVWGTRTGSGVTYGPANDEIQKLISAAYDVVARGGSQEEVYARRQDAINAFIKAGRTPQDAVRAVDTALSAKEPVRVLTGREMTPAEEQRWVSRMTPEQKKAYDTAVQAWGLLGAVTGKDLNMVSAPPVSSGGGGPSFPGVTSPAAAASPVGLVRSPAAGISTPATTSGISRGTYGRLSRIRRPSYRPGGRRRRQSLRATTSRRRSPGVTRRRLRY